MVRVAFVMGDYPGAEVDRRAKTALSFATPEVEVGIVKAPVTPYFYGMSPTEMTLVAPDVIASFFKAQQEGYDAVVPLGFLDLGVEAGRSAVDIPVLGPMQSALHVAGLLGDRFGLIAYHENQFANLEGLVRHYGFLDKVVGIADSGFDLPDIAANETAMIETFVASARKLIHDKRAEIIIPTGISQCPVHMDPRWLSNELGVPVVEGIGAPIKLAGMFAQLGLRHSRRRYPKSPTYAAKQ